MSRRRAFLCNIVVPGAGLIALRREWLGFALALLFCLTIQVAVVGSLLTPASVPPWGRWSAGTAALAVWCWSQWLFRRQLSIATGETPERELRLLCRRAAEAVDAERLEEAGDLLRAALTLNDEDVEVNVCWARLQMRMRRRPEARRAWRRVLQLCAKADVRREATEALRA